MRCDLFRLLLSPSRRGVLRVGADVILRSPLADEFLCPIIELIHEEELPFVMPHKRDSEVIAKIEYLSYHRAYLENFAFGTIASSPFNPRCVAFT